VSYVVYLISYFAAGDSLRSATPKKGEPTHFITSEVMQEFTDWLRDNVLEYIRSQSDKKD
jgi:hypothetical protein